MDDREGEAGVCVLVHSRWQFSALISTASLDVFHRFEHLLYVAQAKLAVSRVLIFAKNA